MPIYRDKISALIPHADAMCLLDSVLEWDETRITCCSGTHRDPKNPMRRDGRLHAVCGIEYVSQAMATHAALTAGQESRSTKGYLASIRNLVLYVNRLDALGGDLIVEAEQIMGESRRALYTFCVTADGRILMTGRAAAVFEVASS